MIKYSKKKFIGNKKKKYLVNINNEILCLTNYFKRFCANNIYIILTAVITAILFNSIDIFTVKFGIDSEFYAINGMKDYVRTNRFGSVFLYYVFPFAKYHIISQLIGITALVFAAALTIANYKYISNTAKCMYVVMLITYPCFSYLQYFYFQSAYNFIGFLFVIAAFQIIKSRWSFPFIFLSIVLLFIGISSYQANFSVFLTVMMINIILDFINRNNIKDNVNLAVKSITVLTISTIIYIIFIYIFAAGFGEYHSNMIGWNTDYMHTILSIMKLILINEITYKIIFFIVVCLYCFFKFNSFKDRIYFIVLSIMFLLAVYSLNILLFNDLLVMRARFSSAFLGPFVILLMYIFFEKNTFIKYLLYVFAFSVVIINGSNIVEKQSSYVIGYEQDKMISFDIINRIYSKYPDVYDAKYNVIFYGNLQHNNHPLRVSSDMFQASFYSADGGNTDRILSFMKILGLNMNVNKYDIDRYDKDMLDFIDTMPVYPHNNSIQLYGNTVIIKLR
ncbi:glucosyltransferase domain-containing protein [uncultured Brachyspira sp.]|uniref:glucosyltransferase domain-containing protein n=1 Tax=uncultured Brachyspira sp. TaxID=221953 RepID=UPI0026326307|nr:glucosyltransferase domain-containing protein [uncultured Brachyspira sp.]